MAVALLISILAVWFFIHLRKVTDPKIMLFADEYRKVKLAKSLSNRCYLVALLTVSPLVVMSLGKLSVSETAKGIIAANLYSITGLVLAIALWFISTHILKRIGD